MTDGENGTGASYLTDVKRALARHPSVYRRFVEVLKGYHDGRLGADGHGDGGNDDDDERVNELETIRQVVTLLRSRPQLVLGFNEFLPPGYRIRMFDQTGYVIEHPRPEVGDGSTAGGQLASGIGRLTVAV